MTPVEEGSSLQSPAHQSGTVVGQGWLGRGSCEHVLLQMITYLVLERGEGPQR